FPGLECPRVGYPSLKKAIEEELESHSMKHRFEDLYLLQVDKVMQLYETMLTRHTTMVVGKTMSGKSAVIECLAGAQKRAFDTPTHLYPINPKMVTVNELYGVLDPATRDWTDGLLSKIFRDINQPVPAGRGAEKRYVLYDGDVDAVWVENMNSVMDDNKILTLNNGERIRLEKHCAMLFEVDNLQYASPATISRCGMVYVDDKDLGPAPFYDRWARGKGEQVEKILMEMFEKWVRPCLALLCDGRVDGEVLSDGPLAGSLPRSQVGTDYVVQLSRIFDSMIVSEEASQKKPQTTAAVFIFTMVWSLGSVLEERTREQFDDFMKNLVK
ncbi:Dynein heavy chain 10, axonemal, partial [Perkinsus olseni]